MHLPANPPNVFRMFKDGQSATAILSKDVGEYAKEFNRRYLHWSEVRMRDTGPFDPDIIWARMKLARMDGSPVLRFGRTGYRYLVTDGIMKALHEFDRRAAARALPDSLDSHTKAYYSVSSMMEESIASSQMEGAVTTTKKAKDMLRMKLLPRNRSERMIVNNYKAMQFIKDNLEQPLTPELIKGIHRIVTDGTLNERFRGRFRDNDDVVVQNPLTGEVFHQPIPAEEIAGSIGQLCEFINDGNEPLHPVLKGIVLHYVIACIHPFEDGNGRVARSLFYWYELKNGYGVMEYLALSRFIKDHKGKYEGAYVFGETDDNDMTYFVLYNLKALAESMDRFEKYLRRRTEEELSTKAELSAYGLNERQISIALSLMGGDSATVRSIQSQYGVSLNTSRSDIKVLKGLGLIAESGKDVNTKVYSWSGRSVRSASRFPWNNRNL